ncbi:MAG: PAS domain S-box protein [Nitrosomonas sp.]|nr:PAS domain S-box protein [Nitrosomonas sp.]MCW5607769.1 PAS domain S-box protein [Nitrosomonas sp.]
MRVNLPVTNHEYPINDGDLILSVTDTKGRITYVNQTFIEVSGFEREELIGKAHNIVRHPDMPPEGFEDLWKTLQSGKPWTGLVKNRRKNGDFYWVVANATPIRQNGITTGYLSVRTKPSRQLIENIEPIYRQFLEGKAKNLKIENGDIVRTDLLGRIGSVFQMTFGKRIALYLSIPGIVLSSVIFAYWSVLQYPESAFWSGNLIVLFSAAGITALCTAWYLIRNETLKPLHDSVEMANSLASGDLRIKISNRYIGDFGQLIKALGQLAINLRTTVSDVQNSASVVFRASSEIADGNLDLSRRTEEQAASLEETASSMEELTSTVSQNAENSVQASQLSSEAAEIVSKGGQMMGDVKTTMSSINESSQKIGSIIGVIDSIAFQTNILALNAAVEAARAGEQGKGFAVVANEVRNLAQKSATAAKEIKSLIDDSTIKVQAGANLVNETGCIMDKIVTSIQKVAEIMSEISSASREQSSGIEQVNQAVMQLDNVTQQNAALVEEAAASAESLETQAKDLLGAISIFKIGREQSMTGSASTKSSWPKLTSSERSYPKPISKKVVNSRVSDW